MKRIIIIINYETGVDLSYENNKISFDIITYSGRM
jgi:hypothetical protein